MALAACAAMPALIALMSVADAGERRPTGWPQTGPVVVFEGERFERARSAVAVPSHRPAGCPAGRACVSCVAGCGPKGKRIVAVVKSGGPVSNWRIRKRRYAGNPNATIYCDQRGCEGLGSGPLSRTRDYNITVHTYRLGW